MTGLLDIGILLILVELFVVIRLLLLLLDSRFDGLGVVVGGC